MTVLAKGSERDRHYYAGFSVGIQHPLRGKPIEHVHGRVFLRDPAPVPIAGSPSPEKSWPIREQTMTLANPMFPADPPACPIAPLGTPPVGGTDLGRRSFLSAAVAVPAALALPAAACASGDDAELLAIGRKLEPLLPEYLALLHEWESRERQAHELATIEAEKAPATISSKVFSKELGRTEEQTGARLADEKFNPVSVVVDSLAETAIKLPCSTLQGLRVHCMVAIVANSHLWFRPEDYDDWCEMATRRQLESLCVVTGIAVPVARPMIERTEAKVRKLLPLAEPPKPTELQLAYSEWLFMERRMLAIEMYGERARDWEPFVPCNTMAGNFHFPCEEGRSWQDVPTPTSRAELVLKAVGVPLEGPAAIAGVVA